MTARQDKADRTAEAVCEGVDFRRATAPRATDALRGLPPFPPSAERCALTMELSMSVWLGGPSASARATNLVGQKWLQSLELFLRKPKQVIGHGTLLSEAMNHRLPCCSRSGMGPLATFIPGKLRVLSWMRTRHSVIEMDASAVLIDF